MLQLALIGPPSPSHKRPRKELLRARIRRTIEDQVRDGAVGVEIVDRITHAVVEELTSRKVPQLDARAALIKLSDGKPRCWICSFPIALDAVADSDGAFSVDHVVPRSRGGGRLGFANLKPAHRFCNSIRGAKQMRAKHRASLRSISRAVAPGRVTTRGATSGGPCCASHPVIHRLGTKPARKPRVTLHGAHRMPFMYCDPPAAIVHIRPAVDRTHAGSGLVTLASGASFQISMPGDGPDGAFVGKLGKTDRIQMCYAPPQRWADAPPTARMAIIGDVANAEYMYGLAMPAGAK